MKVYGILVVILLIQAYVLNSFDVYGLNLQYSWVGFILLGFYLQPLRLPLVGTIFGWLLAVLTGDNTIINTVFGLVVGLFLSVLIVLPWWSLSWIRSLVAVLVVCLFEILLILKIGGLTAEYWTVLLVFTFVHLVSAYFLASLIKEPKHE